LTASRASGYRLALGTGLGESNEEDAGGIRRPVCLISTDSEVPPELVRDILQERRLQS
jgi:hypothetical protein